MNNDTHYLSSFTVEIIGGEPRWTVAVLRITKHPVTIKVAIIREATHMKLMPKTSACRGERQRVENIKKVYSGTPFMP